MAYISARCDDRRWPGAHTGRRAWLAERVGVNLRDIAERFGLNTEALLIRVEDQMTEDADWD
jgi:hypothetical protein